MNIKKILLGAAVLGGLAVAGYLITQPQGPTSPATATVKSTDYLTPKNKVSVPSSTVAGSTSTAKVRALINPPGKQIEVNTGSVIATYSPAGVLLSTKAI